MTVDEAIKEWESVLSRDPLDAPWDLIDDTIGLLKEMKKIIEDKQDMIEILEDQVSMLQEQD